MKIIRLTILSLTIALGLNAQSNKKNLTHNVYDSWKSLRNCKISKDGNIVVYNITPQQGDNELYIYNNYTGKKKKIERAEFSHISPLSDYVIFRIKPFYSEMRKSKLNGVKKEKMPKDTLGIWLKEQNKIIKIPSVQSFQTASEGSNWLAYLHKKEVKQDTIKKKIKLKGCDLVILNPSKSIKHTFSNVINYNISYNGKTVAFTQETGDTIITQNLYIFDTSIEKLNLISKGKKHYYKNPTLSEDGIQLTYLFTQDTSKTKVYSLYYKTPKQKKSIKLVDTLTKEIYKNWTVHPHTVLYFSKNGKKLYFSVAPRPINKPKDTLLDEEKYHVDIWNWKDKYLQPMQAKSALKEKTHTYLAVYNINSKKIIQLADQKIKEVRPQNFGNARYAIAYTNEPYAKYMMWDTYYMDYYIIDTETGKKDKILSKHSNLELSVNQKYAAYYQPKDSMWHIIDIKTGKDNIATKNLNVNFYNELHDMPIAPNSYGVAGWTQNDKYLLIYDKYDIWKIDPTGKQNPSMLTKGYGRDNNITFRYKKLNNNIKYIDEENILLTAFNNENKQGGLYTININGKSSPKKLIMDDANFPSNDIIKAQNANKLIWRKGNFQEYPELHYSDVDIDNTIKLSETNPQQNEYNWGSVQLVSWITGDGEKMQGKLYIPENIDKSQKYPMLVYFYERSSHKLHQHSVPRPSWSIINIPYCVSNGYIVFVPDISYNKEGYPGESAYSSIVTGTLAMLQKFPFIDKNNMALQGQSWGGYQIAYLITRTNLYKCAMAGAPVSNMTSAYGGIRWKTGMSRMFQYEKTQSRIGGTLWDNIIEYIENSPIFFVPKIETPLLIMHNDSDGAVPWYQGIELFNAMRRLEKPVWMLVYNNEKHNLVRRANRKDLSKRTMQFFDYYLKGSKEPEWMKNGVPAHKKGEIDGY